jgi:hypothetical protein
MQRTAVFAALLGLTRATSAIRDFWAFTLCNRSSGAKLSGSARWLRHGSHFLR